MKELKRLRIKFVASNMAMVTLVIGLAFLAVGYFTTYRMNRDNERMLWEAAAAGQTPVFWGGDEVRMPYFILVTDGDNQIVHVEGQYGPGQDSEMLQRLAAQSLSSAEDGGFLEMYQLRYLRRPLGSGYRIAYMDTSLGDSFAEGMWRNLGIIGVAVWVMLFGISCVLSKWAVYPVGQSMRREKQFVADASHELKTPLTVIMANAQLLTDQEPSADGDGARWLKNIVQEAEEMKKLVEEMLALARSEADMGKRVREKCNFSDVVIESVLSFEAVFYQGNRELQSDVEEDICIRGDEKELRQMMRILLDNAEKYSPEGGRTRVCLKRMPGRKVQLIVENTGEEIPGEGLEEIFERFYRSDESRSDRKGYGLGLAIAKSVAERHRGTIRAESSDGENRFIVEFRAVDRGQKEHCICPRFFRHIKDFLL